METNIGVRNEEESETERKLLKPIRGKTRKERKEKDTTKVVFNKQLAGQESLESDNVYMYLGQLLQAQPTRKKSKSKTGTVWSALGKHVDIVKSSNLRLLLKRKVNNQYIPPVTAYDSGTWHLTERTGEKTRKRTNGNGEEKARSCKE